MGGERRALKREAEVSVKLRTNDGTVRCACDRPCRGSAWPRLSARRRASAAAGRANGPRGPTSSASGAGGFKMETLTTCYLS